jgi:hypothetical protein
MRVPRYTCMLWLALLVAGICSRTAAAQVQARVSCQGPNQPQAVTEADAALERNPDELTPRLKLADALVDQGCYQDAVTILEAGQQIHPHSSELSGKLRDVRSMVTEQTYIEGLTQAEESAKLQRNQIRCTRLADVESCDEALKYKPNDQQLLAAKAAAEPARSNPANAQPDQQPPTSRVAPEHPAPQRVAPKIPSIAVATAKAPPKANGMIADTWTRKHGAAPSDAAESLAAAQHLVPPEPTYSNDAPAGRSN